MTHLRTRLSDESGQVLIFVAVILTGLIGMAALVVDVGSWYHADRQLQTVVDAAALAGAQELPSQSTATNTAEEYARLNDAGIPAPDVTFPDAATIDVVAHADTRGIFAPVLNAAFDVVTVNARAQAQIRTPHLKNVVPIAIPKDFACVATDEECFGPTVPIDFDVANETDGTRSKFGLLDLNLYNDHGCSTGNGIKEWIEEGYSCPLPVDTDYPIFTGDKNGIKNELRDRVGDEMLIPIYDTSSDRGYLVIGWAGFVIDRLVEPWNSKHHHILEGHFVKFDREAFEYDGETPGGTDFGVPLLIRLTK